MSEHVPLEDSDDLRQRLDPLLNWDLRSWRGLPRFLAAALVRGLGEPAQREETRLGWYPAQRWAFPLETPSGGLAGYVRHDEVVMVETCAPPPASALAGLEAPCAVLAHEISLPGAYVHEYLYCDRGLVLSIAEFFDPAHPQEIVRCRGIRPIARPEEFGPELYQPLEDRQAW